MANSYYTRTYAFASNTTARGSEVKAEFDGLVAGMDVVEADTKRSIKMPSGADVELPAVPADRSLKVIGFDANGDVEIQSGVGAFRGDWAAGADYKIRDIITDAGGALGLDNVYISNKDHISSAGLVTDVANWDLMIDVTDVKASEVAAAASAAAALASEGLADANATATAADRVQTGLDAASTAANLVATNQDSVDTAANLAATNQDTIDTAADVVTTNANVVLTGLDVTSAENAKTAAEAAQAASEAIYDDFDDRYLGSFETVGEPTLNNDGDALLDGALYWNKTVPELRVYDLTGTAWVSINNYTHPNDGGGNQTALTGVSVYSDIEINAAGHVTSTSVRTLTKTDIDSLGVDAESLDGYDNTGFLKSDSSDIVSQLEAEAGVSATARAWSALRVKQAIQALVQAATETVAGIVERATQPEVDAGIDDARYVSPKKLRFGFSILLAANGYIVFPSWMKSLIIQWGFIPNIATIGDKSETVVFQLAFPNAAFYAAGTVESIALSQNIGVYVTGKSTTGMTVVLDKDATSTVTVGLHYVAIGH